MSSPQYKKFLFYKILENERRERWNKINGRFAKNDSPAGCKLMATGCMERFDHPRDEERMSKQETAKREFSGASREEWLERDRLSQIRPGMSLEEIHSILNPEQEQ